MKNLIFILSIIISNFTFSQVKAVVINSKTKEKIPYVNIWVENENIGTTSNENGEFHLNIDTTKTLIFSAIGYEKLKIKSSQIRDFVKLKPSVTKLPEIVINSKKEKRELVINHFKKYKIHNYYACGKKPWIIANFFKYKPEYNQTKYLKKLKILTKSHHKNTKFNIRLLNIDDDGKPNDYLYNRNILGIAKKGKKITEIDLSNLNIQFPKKGFFVAVEWLIIDANKYQFKYTGDTTRKKHIGIEYDPLIGAIPPGINTNIWFFVKGKWQHINTKTVKNSNERFGSMAIELILSN